MMHLKYFAGSVLVALFTAVMPACRADTLTLRGTGGQVVGGVSVYPYDLSVNGSPETLPMMCINYDDHITQGETWAVSGQQITVASGLQLGEDAWLFSQVGKGSYSLADIQFAVWDVLDPGVDGNPGLDVVAKHLVSLAVAAAPGLTDAFLEQYIVLSPDLTDQSGWTDGKPQSFILANSAVTPEPSSLLLLGTGLASASVLLMRRRALQETRQPHH